MKTREREPDLPILDEIGADLSAAFARAEAAEAPRPLRRRRLRQLAIATGVLLVAVPGAVATRDIWAPSPGDGAAGGPNAGRAVEVAEGRTARQGWRFSAFDGADGLCWQFALFSSSRASGQSVVCQDPAQPETHVAGRTAVGRGETLAYGWAPPRAARVEVRVGGRRQTARLVIPQADRVRRAGVPRDLRFYVATFPGEIGGATRVAVFDADGRELAAFPPSR